MLKFESDSTRTDFSPEAFEKVWKKDCRMLIFQQGDPGTKVSWKESGSFSQKAGEKKVKTFKTEAEAEAFLKKVEDPNDDDYHYLVWNVWMVSSSWRSRLGHKNCCDR